jgi:uncharacterized protein YoaH (UPF0181 family)
MDTKLYEPLLRKTVFSQRLLESAWGAFSDTQRLEILLYFNQVERSISTKLLEMALNSDCEAIRILATKLSYVREKDNPELARRISEDESSIVQKIGELSGISLIFSGKEKLLALSHEQQLAAIALTESVLDEVFVGFIKQALEARSLTEGQAAACVAEYVRNPLMTRHISRDSLDGLDWHGRLTGFKAIWSLCTCTPEPVHRFVAWEYPMEMGTDLFADGIPRELLEKMSGGALEALAFRQCPELLRWIEEQPESVSKEVKEEAKSGARRKSKPTPSETQALTEAVAEYHKEMSARLDGLRDVTDNLARKRGLFL